MKKAPARVLFSCVMITTLFSPPYRGHYNYQAFIFYTYIKDISGSSIVLPEIFGKGER